MIIDRVPRLIWNVYIVSEVESVIDFWWRKLDELAGIDWFGMKLEKTT